MSPVLPFLYASRGSIDNSNEAETRPTRGSAACVVGAGPGHPVYNEPLIAHIPGSNRSIKRGRSLGVQCLNGYMGYHLVVEQPWTEEPTPITRDAGGGSVVQDRQTTIEVPAPVSSAHNAMQGLALSQLAPTLIAPEPSEPESFLQTNPETTIKDDDVNAGSNTFHKQRTCERNYLHRLREASILAVAPAIAPVINKELHIQRGQEHPNATAITTHHKHPPRNCPPLRAGTDPAPLSWGPRTKKSRVPPYLPLRTFSTHGPHEAVPHSVSESPLLTSLFTGSHKPPVLFMLAVAVAYNDLKDPQHDFELIQTWLKGNESRSVRFQGISGEEATRERIEGTIGKLYCEALEAPGSNLLILLTGEGDYTNKMHLMGGRFITDSDLRLWLWKLRNESKPVGVPTTIILDYCRTNKHIPLGAAQEGVRFIWSCSLGQTAAALSLRTTEGIPRSCFLLALMMSSYSYTYIKTDLRATIDHELDRLSRFLGFTYEKVHKEERCGLCRNEKKCERPPPQTPDWQQVGCMKPVHDLAYVLSTVGVNIVPKVYRVLMNNRWFREANELPINWVLRAKHDAATPGSTVRYKRGTCQSVDTGMPVRAIKRDWEAMNEGPHF